MFQSRLDDSMTDLDVNSRVSVLALDLWVVALGLLLLLLVGHGV